MIRSCRPRAVVLLAQKNVFSSLVARAWQHRRLDGCTSLNGSRFDCFLSRALSLAAKVEDQRGRASEISIKHRQTRQQGQALVLGVLLVGVAILALTRSFSVGQLVAARVKQTHALDAAAYSGALVQARALNMLAYLNRTQVAHQVALAHLATLGSWAALGDTEARQLLSANPPVYLISMLFGASYGKSYAAAAGAAGLGALALDHGELGRAFARHDNLVHDMLQVVQHDVYHSVPSARMAAMQAVLAANYAPGQFQLTLDEDGWPSSIRYNSGRSLAPFVRRVGDLYEFLGNRNVTVKNVWSVDARCPASRHQLRRRGSTRMDDSGLWESIDTQSFHALRSNRWIGCYFREYPMGWGWIPGKQYRQESSPYVENPPDNFSAQDFWRWVKESTTWDIASGDANPLANSKAAAARIRWNSGGLPVYLDIAGKELPKLGFRVSLRHPGPDSLTITTQSAAETFFQRPDSWLGSAAERANLFHPYWQARLRSSGQALLESVLVVLVLILLWSGFFWLGRLQDMALQAQHASRFAAFSFTRNPDAQPLEAIKAGFFAGPAHRWARQNGQQLLSATRSEISMVRSNNLQLDGLSQPGGNAQWAESLRQDWQIADQGIVRASIDLSSLDSHFPTLQRQTAILQGAGHASSDAQTQIRIGQSVTSWKGAFSQSKVVTDRVNNRMAPVDAAWARQAAGLDWLSAWAGYIPEQTIPGGAQ